MENYSQKAKEENYKELAFMEREVLILKQSKLN